MLKRHHNVTSVVQKIVIPAASLSQQPSKKAEKIKRDMNKIERELTELLGIDCHLKVVLESP